MALDLRADIHGHVLDFVRGVDGAWFAAHPGERDYMRPELAHEWCLYLGRCVEPDGDVLVNVTHLGPGLHLRSRLEGSA